MPMRTYLRSRRRAGVMLLGLLLVTLGACGGGGDRPGLLGGATGSPSPSPSASTTPTVRPTRTSSPPSVRPTRSSPRASVKATPTLPGKLDRSCVRQGVEADVQGLTVGTTPGGPVGYTTIYSDGSSQLDPERGYKTGGGGGFAEDNGTFRQTWIVPAHAPLGTATVRVIDGSRTFDLPFVIVAASATCT